MYNKRKYSDEMYRWAVIQARTDIGHDYTRNEYDQWRKSTPDQSVVPSSATLIRKYNTWEEMKDKFDLNDSDFYGPNLLLKLKQ